MKKKNNVLLIEFDPFIVKVYDSRETKEFFGDDWLEEEGVFIPEELLERYKRNIKEFMNIQKELKAYKEIQDKKIL